ncbi:MAG: dUTPase [Christensenellales bacterium]|jgi:dimeric dUTPase (all-alpha-NTP-PPase superfamily)
MTDKLDAIFAMQKQLNDEIVEKRHLEAVTQSEWIQKLTLATLSELSEVLDEVNFKWWKNEKPVDEAKLQEELVDVLHFFISMCLRANLTPDALYEKYLAKNEENFRRQRGLSEKKGYSITES